MIATERLPQNGGFSVQREQVLAKLRERIVLFAASHLSRDVAEDLAQEVLMLLHEKYAHLERAEDLLPLSLQIVRFKIMSLRRKAVRRGEYTQVSITDIPLPDLDANPADSLERKEMLERLERCIAQLGDRCRQLIRLKLQGKTFPEIQKHHGRRRTQYRIYVGPPVPQESARPDGRPLGREGQMMDRQDIQKLLGGYATGTLTPEEQQILFEAALTDQELFDALAREQSLRDLLNDPAARAQLLAALDEKPLPWYRQFWRPAAIVAAAAACLLIAGVYLARPKPHPAATPLLVAEVKQPEPPAAPPQTPRPAVADRPASSPRRATPMKKAPAEPAPENKDMSGLFAPAVPAAAPAPPAARNEAVAPTPSAVATMAAPAPKDFGAVGGVVGGGGGSAGSLSALPEGDSKPIPLQNAQALFYAPQQTVVSGALQEQQAAGLQQQQPRDKKEQQRIAAPLKALSALGAARATYLGVKYTVLRRNEAGDFVEVEPNQLHAGDSVKLQFLPNDGGFLSLWDSGVPVLQSAKVERLIKFDTPVVTSDRPGRKVLTVQFTRAAPQTGLIRNAAEQQSATDSQEHATYVVNAKTDSLAPISTTIFLTFK